MNLKPDLPCAERIGVARLIRFAFEGNDLSALHAALLSNATEPGAAMDLAVVEQIFGNREGGLAIQSEALRSQHLYRSPGCTTTPPRLRVLALAGPVDVGGNTPIEFLITERDIELTTLYVVPGQAIADSLPEHDIAIVVMSDGDECAASLEELAPLAAAWPRPLLNPPDRVAQTDRDRLFRRLQGVSDLEIPVTSRVSRDEFARIASGEMGIPLGVNYPMVVRPVGSHAGRGLERLDDGAAALAYLASYQDGDFFLMRFVDFSGADGQFRKYRIVVIDGQPFACHMAIADQWKIWYLNAGMADGAAKRAEEASFMENFDNGFGLRHGAALAELARRIGLDYFSIDCAEDKSGNLLVFEVGVAMVVHDMDPVAVYPYKAPQMAKVFAAFVAMLDRRVAESKAA